MMQIRNYVSTVKDSAVRDFLASFYCWRISYIIGISEIRNRYNRSKIGQFWLTVPLAVNIATLGIIWSYLFKLSASDYVPFLSIGIVFWAFVSSCITEGASVYIKSSSYLLALNIPKLSYINALLIKNFIILMHNMIVLVIVYLFFFFPTSIEGLFLSVLGLILTVFFIMPIIVIVGIISLRFRDFVNIIASVTQIIFYLTPVMWKIDLMPKQVFMYLIFNPFAVFLSICRDPLLLHSVSPIYYLASIFYIFIAWIAAFLFFSKFQRRITYWL